MTDARTVTSPQRYLSEDGVDLLQKCVVQDGVAVSCIGWQMGKALLVREACVTNQQINTVVPEREDVDLLYLYYNLSSRREEIFRLGAGGSRTPILNKSAFSQLEIELPPLPEQQRIAHILGTLDDKIELNRRMNRTLEAIARAIFKSWFVDFDPVHAKAEGREPVGMDPETAALFPDSFQDSPLGKIPKGWEIGNLNLIAARRQQTVKPEAIEDGTPYVSLDDVPRKSIALSSWKRAAGIASAKSRFHQSDVLFGKLRPYFHKVVIAPVDGICSTDIIVVCPVQEAWSAYVLMICSSVEFIAYNSAVMTGTKMPRTNWRDMSRYELVIPPRGFLEAYQAVAEPLVHRLVAGIRGSLKLSATRDLLLPELLSGRVGAGGNTA